MGAAIDAFSESFGIVRRTPLLVAVAFATFVLGGAVGLILGLIPLVGPLVNFVVVVPLMLAGSLAITDAAADGDASLSDFTRGVGENWKSLMGAYAILFCVLLLAGIAFVFLFAVVGVGLMSVGSTTSGSSSALAGLGLVALLVGLVGVLVAVVVGIVVQFIDVAVVIGDRSASGAFGEAWHLFVTAPLSVLGYGLLRGAIVVAMYVVPLGVLGGVLLTGTEPSALLLVAVGLLFLVLAPVATALATAYHVAYYRRRRPVATTRDDGARTDAAAGAAGWR